MDIGAIVSTSYSIWSIASFLLAIFGTLSLIALAIGAFTRLGKAAWRFGLALLRKQIKVVADTEDYDTIYHDLDDPKQTHYNFLYKSNKSFLYIFLHFL